MRRSKETSRVVENDTVTRLAFSCESLCLLQLLAVASLISFLRPVAAAVAPPSGPDKIILLGRVLVKWDGFRGVHRTDTTGFTVVVARKVDKPTEQTFKHEAHPDENGYFVLANMPREGTYSYTRVKIGGGRMPVPVAMFHRFEGDSKTTEGGGFSGGRMSGTRSVGTDCRVIQLGEMTLTVDAEGGIGGEIKAMELTVGYSKGTLNLSQEGGPSMHKYFLKHFGLGEWRAIVKADLARIGSGNPKKGSGKTRQK